MTMVAISQLAFTIIYYGVSAAKVIWLEDDRKGY